VAGEGGAAEGELAGEVSVQLRAFAEEGTLGQAHTQPSTAATLEGWREWNDGASLLTFELFGRLDGRDRRRTHGDVREAYLTHLGEDWTLHLGVKRVFWGTTEAKHLVDVVNQVDFVEDLDEETRLGQPMAQLELRRVPGTLELFLLPGFRQRSFPGPDGRLGGPVIVDGDSRFTASQGILHTDWAVRWSGRAGGLDLGLAHFDGTSREPEFEVLGPVVRGEPIRLRPVYPLVTQSSVDAQYVTGDWALKLEAFHRRGEGDDSRAFVAGFERTLVGAFGTRADLGVLAEYLYDGRGDRAPLLAFERDVFVGLRVALNDFAGTRLLAGLIHDHRTGERLWVAEGRRRLGDAWELSADLRAVSGVGTTEPGDLGALLDPRRKLGLIAGDSYLQLELRRFF
jgi:hypothetical protein